MTILPHDVSDEELKKVVLDWLGLLQDNRFQEAYDQTLHESDDSWDQLTMRMMISNYGNPAETAEGEFRITLPNPEKNALTLDKWRFDLFRLPAAVGDVIGSITCDFPLNGEWSDLSAVFNLERVEGGIALSLLEIGVL